MQSQYEERMVGEVGLTSPTVVAQSDKTKMYKEREREWGGRGGLADDFNETYPCWAVFFHWGLT